MKVDGKTGDVEMSWGDRRAIVLHAAAFTCEMCHEAPATEVDHIWPRSWGGKDDLENLQATCLPCNRAKGGKALISNIDLRRAEWAVDHFRDKAVEAMAMAVLFTKVHRRLWFDQPERPIEDIYKEAQEAWGGNYSSPIFRAIDEALDPAPDSSFAAKRRWNANDAASHAQRLAVEADRAQKAVDDFNGDLEVLLPRLTAGECWGEAYEAQREAMAQRAESVAADGAGPAPSKAAA